MHSLAHSGSQSKRYVSVQTTCKSNTALTAIVFRHTNVLGNKGDSMPSWMYLVYCIPRDGSLCQESPYVQGLLVNVFADYPFKLSFLVTRRL